MSSASSDILEMGKSVQRGYAGKVAELQMHVCPVAVLQSESLICSSFIFIGIHLLHSNVCGALCKAAPDIMALTNVKPFVRSFLEQSLQAI